MHLEQRVQSGTGPADSASAHPSSQRGQRCNFNNSYNSKNTLNNSGASGNVWEAY